MKVPLNGLYYKSVHILDINTCLYTCNNMIYMYIHIWYTYVHWLYMYIYIYMQKYFLE